MDRCDLWFPPHPAALFVLPNPEDTFCIREEHA